MNNPVATLPHSTFIRARKRISIALATLEDGMCFDLLAPEDVVQLLNAALGDLDEARLAGQQEVATSVVGLNWNDYEFLAAIGDVE
jgi:hypothetical protein